MTVNAAETARIDGIFRSAAKRALAEWGRDSGADDLAQEMWVWYLESPATQEKFYKQDEPLTRMMSHKAAMQILTREALDEDVFDGKTLYSTDAIKGALKGESTNKYLRAILPIARESLAERNEAYAEAIRGRYDDGVVPLGADADRLRHAVKALTDEVNVTYITSSDEGAGSSSAVFPDERKPGGKHGDPTADTALRRMEDPELVDQVIYETPMGIALLGAQALPVYDQDGNSRRTQPEEVFV